MSRFSVAKDMVIQHLDTLVPELFGGGRHQTRMVGGRWEVANKWRAGAGRDQMTVWRTGGRRGAWKDFVCGDKGDAIDLIAYALEGIVHDDSRMRALEWIESRFGIRDMSQERRREISREAEIRRQQMLEAETKRVGSSRDRARKAFYGSQAQILGTPVETYARSRGVDLADVPQLAPSFRYRPDGQFWPGRQRDGEGNTIGRAPEFPVMMSAMVDAQGKIGANHYTFLEPDGSAKLDTRARGYLRDDGKPWSPKLMFPDTGGLYIRVTRGPSGLSCEDAAQRGVTGWILWTEGIEDGWSFAIADPELRVHAAGSLSGFLTVPDLACARGHLVARDNDWDKPQAVEQFEAAIVHFKSFGKPVEEVAMPREWGKDANDVLNLKG